MQRVLARAVRAREAGAADGIEVGVVGVERPDGGAVAEGGDLEPSPAWCRWCRSCCRAGRSDRSGRGSPGPDTGRQPLQGVEPPRAAAGACRVPAPPSPPRMSCRSLPAANRLAPGSPLGSASTGNTRSPQGTGTLAWVKITTASRPTTLTVPGKALARSGCGAGVCGSKTAWVGTSPVAEVAGHRREQLRCPTGRPPAWPTWPLAPPLDPPPDVGELRRSARRRRWRRS